MVKFSDGSVLGRFYDGRSAIPQDILVFVVDGGLRLELSDDRHLFWGYEDLREQGSDLHVGRMVLSHAGNPGAFVSFESESLVRHVRVSSGNLSGDFSVGSVFLLKLWVGIGGFAAFVLLLLYVVIPPLSERIAPYVSYDFEERIGAVAYDTILDAIGVYLRLQGRGEGGEGGEGESVLCSSADVAEHLARISGDLHSALGDAVGAESDLSGRLRDVGVPRVVIVNLDSVNALALPGNSILLFRGLFEGGVDSYSELVGILAHEMAHVAGRHHMRLLISDSAALLFLEILADGLTDNFVWGGLLGQATQARYTQEMEQEADDLSIPLLLSLGGDPLVASHFFARLGEAGGNVGDDSLVPPYIADIFATHPGHSSRIANYRAHANPKGDTLPQKYGDFATFKEQVKEECWF